MQNRVERTVYLEWLKSWREKQLIKVVSGVRRCGKSTLFDIYKDWLISDGIEKNQIISLNFEDIEFEPLSDYHALYSYIKERLVPDKMNYIFLDEIQHVNQFEKAVDSLFLKENCDVYITGSNAYFMSGELATVLTGRYIELKMLPLSFKEFCAGLEHPEQNRFQAVPERKSVGASAGLQVGINSDNMSNAQKFNLYMEQGSFPYLLKYKCSKNEAKDYLRDIYHSVLLKDIVARLNVSEVTALENITKFLLHNIGNIVSATKIANTLKVQGKGADQKTIDKYLRGLTDSLMFYEAQRYNLKGRMFLKTNSKYYTVDIGLRNTLVKGSESDIGHILENIVFLELKRRGYEVYIGQLADGEIDFVAVKGDDISYYQVSATTLDETVLTRELAPFKKIGDNYPKYLLTLDEIFGTADYNGIKKQNVLEWLLKDG